MPSTLVHVAVGGLVGAALLGRWFDLRAILVVLAAASIPDLDSFTSTILPGSHRSLFHSLVFPLVLAALLVYDTRIRERSMIRDQWGTRGVVVAWVALAALLAGGIMPDLFTNGVNVFYPFYDAFYAINGEALWSSTRGFVQTFVELQSESPPRTTETLHYSTVVDPSPGAEPENVERIAPLASSGLELMLVILGGFVVGGRLVAERVWSPRN
ncbi:MULTISPECIES: metal-dependent hydrolase [Haloferax]|uniref:Metal-dependent hydrolase n=1 Tax=Haloferax marinum TaxID=2666143 RepID=A0A6A8G8D8_9EURY|nr:MULTISPECIES: metal-dependent hydrolase [Haloferax]KAB1198429.1 metal-dependent hydrolase [Haloferax sp. CBA1150]MRW97530.1 metal-dependent hydrolase [Haloferax marinum]